MTTVCVAIIIVILSGSWAQYDAVDSTAPETAGAPTGGRPDAACRPNAANGYAGRWIISRLTLSGASTNITWLPDGIVHGSQMIFAPVD